MAHPASYRMGNGIFSGRSTQTTLPFSQPQRLDSIQNLLRVRAATYLKHYILLYNLKVLFLGSVRWYRFVRLKSGCS